MCRLFLAGKFTPLHVMRLHHVMSTILIPSSFGGNSHFAPCLFFGGKQKLTKAIYDRKQPLESALQQGEQFLTSSGKQLPPSKKSDLDSKMTSLEARWRRLQSELDNRYMRLVLIHEKLTRFEELLHPFLVSFVFILVNSYSQWNRLDSSLHHSSRGRMEA